jgi:hypothetical protein
MPAFIGILALFATIFGLVFNLLHSEIEAAHTETKDLQGQIGDLKVDNAHLADALAAQKAAIEASSLRVFWQDCEALKGKPDYNLKTCNPPDGRPYRYEAPFP